MRDSDIDSLSADGAQDTEKMAGPRTAAGRKVYCENDWHSGTCPGCGRSIEAEAAAPAPLDADHVHVVPLGYGDHEATEGETYSLVQCRVCMGMIAVAPGRRALARLAAGDKGSDR